MSGSNCRTCQAPIRGVRACLRCGAPRPWQMRRWLLTALSFGFVATLFALAAHSSGAPLFRNQTGVRLQSQGPSFEPDDYDEPRTGS